MKYEYKVLDYSYSQVELTESLNELGGAGWRVIEMNFGRFSVQVCLERVLP